LEEVLAAGAVDHNPLPGQQPGRLGVIDTLAMYRAAFPDLELTIENQVADGDLIVQNGLATGTNSGPLMGMPPTRKSATFPWIDIYRVADRQITEIWHLEDLAGMLRQLGALPG
jgi:predicted ester cyclase